MAIVLTGDRPTGKLHLGHYAGSLKNRVKLQDEYKSYIMIADTQALSDNYENPEKIKISILEVVKDYLAVGIDPKKCTIFIQSLVPELAELTMYYMNMVTIARLGRNPTVKNEMQQKGMEESVPAGFFCYPVSQTADITAFKAEIIPVGEDQLPMIEQTNEIVRRFNHTYKKDVLVECEAMLSNVRRLVGIDGNAKASKSLNNAIFLDDDESVIKAKVDAMYTDPQHIKVSDPGHVEGNVVFEYLDAFYSNKQEVEDLKQQYTKGGLGDLVLKSMLFDCLKDMLKPIREKRRSLVESELLQMLMDLSKVARDVAKDTLYDVKEAIGINY